MSYQVLGAREWAELHFGSVKLSDKRLTRRAVQVAAAMASDPSGSIPQQAKNWKKTKGTYRLFDHERATFEAMSQVHWDQTRCAAGECDVTLLIQDTTWLNYGTHLGTRGLGRHGRAARKITGKGQQSCRPEGHGLLLHSVLAIEPRQQVDSNGNAMTSGRVLGLAWGKLWARDEQEAGRQRTARRCSAQRESTRWKEAVDQVGAPPPGGCGRRWIHVGDRESDIFELYERTAQLPGLGFIIRMKHTARGAVAGHDPRLRLTGPERPHSTLGEVCREMSELGCTKLWVSPRDDQPGRWAKLVVSGGPITIYSPIFGPVGSRTARPLHCWAVRVWEIDPPEGVDEPIEWILLSSEAVNSLSDALRVVEYYSLRWLIEEYHKCLKSGCRVEARQLESADRLAPLIGISSIVATRLLQLKNDARLAPDRPAKECVEPAALETMAKLLKLDRSDKLNLTIRRFVHEVAKLGGFLGRKGDGDPGWLTLWRGWRELNLITLGHLLASGDVGNG